MILLIVLHQVKAQTVYNDLMKYSPPKFFQDFFQSEIFLYFRQKLSILPNFQHLILQIVLVGLQSYLFYSLNLELLFLETNIQFVLNYFILLLCTPFLVFVGALIENTNFFGNLTRRYLLLPIICNMLSILSIGIQNLTSQQEIFSEFSSLFGLFLPLAVCQSLSLGMFTQDFRIIKSLFSFIGLFFIFVPYFILLPIAKFQRIYELENFKNVFDLGITLISLHLLFYFLPVIWQVALPIVGAIKDQCESSDIDIVDFMDDSYRYGMLWVHNINYIFVFHILVYIIQLENSQKCKGILIGLLIFLFLIFLCDFYYLNEIITVKKDEQKNQYLQRRSKIIPKRIKLLITYVQIFAVLFFLPFYFGLKDEMLSLVMLSLAIGIPIVPIYCSYLLYLITDSTDQQAINFTFFIMVKTQKLFLSYVIFLFFRIETDHEILQIQDSFIVVQLLMFFIFVLARVSLYYQRYHREQNRIQSKWKKIFKIFSQKKIFISKKMLKRLDHYMRDNPLSLIQNFYSNPEIALLQYKRKKQEDLLFIFLQKIQKIKQKKTQIQDNFFQEKLSQFLKLIFFENKEPTSSISQIRQELSLLNLKKSEEQLIINSLYQQEGERLKQLIQPENESQNNQEQSKLINILTCQNCSFKKNKIDFQISEFKNSSELKIYLNLNSCQKYSKILDATFEIQQSVYGEKFIGQGEFKSYWDLFSLILRLYDYYTIIASPLDILISHSNTNSELFQFVDFSFILNDYYFTFYLALSMTGLYLILGLIAIRQVIQGTYGLDENRKKLQFIHLKYWFCKLVQLTHTLGVFISKTYLGILFCQFNEQPSKVLVEPTMICMSDTHIIYIIISLIGFIIFFPISTFLFPTLQYNDKSTDFRFEQSYVVLYNSIKIVLVVIYITTTANKQFAFIISIQGFFMQILIYYCRYRQPCKINYYNRIEQLIFFEITILCYGATTALEEDSQIAGWTAFGVMNACYFCCCCLMCFTTSSKKHKINPY